MVKGDKISEKNKHTGRKSSSISVQVSFFRKYVNLHLFLFDREQSSKVLKEALFFLKAWWKHEQKILHIEQKMFTTKNATKGTKNVTRGTKNFLCYSNKHKVRNVIFNVTL